MPDRTPTGAEVHFTEQPPTYSAYCNDCSWTGFMRSSLASARADAQTHLVNARHNRQRRAA